MKILCKFGIHKYKYHKYGLDICVNCGCGKQNYGYATFILNKDDVDKILRTKYNAILTDDEIDYLTNLEREKK